MEVKINFANEQAVQQAIKMNMDKLGNVVRDAMREAAMETRDFMQAAGAEDIAEAGNFGQRWQDAFQVEVTETQRTFRVTAKMEASEPPVVYWPVFEYGKTIEAKNPSGYMWLPFRGAEGTDVWPRVYGSENLFRITSKSGLPMLLDRETKEPKYFGKESVTIPKKFHLHEIMRDEAKKAKAAFKRILAEMRAE
jgi:hypothetical protein